MITPPSLEMHCHSMFSVDGFCTPETVVDCAAMAGVKYLSLTDHNSIGGTKRAAKRAAEWGLSYIPGVEIDAVFGGDSYHFLAYRFDPDNAALNKLLADNEQKYNERYQFVLAELQKGGVPLTEQEQADFFHWRYPTHPKPIHNAFGLSQLPAFRAVPKDWYGQLKSMREKLAINPDYKKIRFCDLADALAAVKEAGGLMLLAHPGNYLPGNPDAQVKVIKELLSFGVDGFELYHHSNMDGFKNNRDNPPFPVLSALAAETGCLISGGSDSHNAFLGIRPVGGCGAPIDIAERFFG